MSLPPRLHFKHGAYYYVTGRPHRRWIRLDTDLQTALRKWAQIEADGQLPQASANPLMNDLFRRYEREVLPTKALKTQLDQRRQLKRLSAVLGQMPVTAITPVIVAEYLDRHPAKTAANREVALLSHAFSKAVRWGWAASNPCRGVSRHKETARTRFVTDEELARLLAHAAVPIRTAILLAYFTAQRLSDILSLTWEQVQGRVIEFRQSKTQARLSVEISRQLQQVLDAAWESRAGPYVVHTQQGKAYTVSGFETMFKRAKAAAGLDDLHFHDIRAKAATDLEDMSVPLRDIQGLLGHKTQAMTERYIKAHKPRRVKSLRRGVGDR